MENLGLDEGTIVVLWGDHGWQLGEHALWCKHSNFSTSTRIPLIFKIPGKSANIKQEALVETVDLYPTLCDLAGINSPLHLQGKSFVKLLDDPKGKMPYTVGQTLEVKQSSPKHMPTLSFMTVRVR